MRRDRARPRHDRWYLAVIARHTPALADRVHAICVLFVCGVNGHGGPVRSLCTVLRDIPDVHRVVASQPRSDGSSDLEQSADEFVPMARPRGLRGLLVAQAQLLRRWRWVRANVDVVHANGLTEAMVVLPLALCTKTDVVVWVHNWAVPRSFGRIGRLRRRAMRDWRWIAVSDLSRQLVVEAGGPSSDEIAIVPNPVDPNVVPRRRVASGRKRICFLAGTDRASKGFDLIAPTARAVGRPDVMWLIYTSPPHATNAEGWSALFALTEIHYETRTRVQDIAEAFAECDVVFSPSRHESFNRVIAEAMTNGIPVVASDLQVHRELLGVEEAGLVFPVDDAAAAARCLRRILDDEQLATRLGVRGKRLAERFRPEPVIRALRKVYDGPASRTDLRA